MSIGVPVQADDVRSARALRVGEPRRETGLAECRICPEGLVCPQVQINACSTRH